MKQTAEVFRIKTRVSKEFLQYKSVFLNKHISDTVKSYPDAGSIILTIKCVEDNGMLTLWTFCNYKDNVCIAGRLAVSVDAKYLEETLELNKEHKVLRVVVGQDHDDFMKDKKSAIISFENPNNIHNK